MKSVMLIGMILNLLLIFVILFGQILVATVKNNPNLIAKYYVMAVVVLFFYLLSLMFFAVAGILNGEWLNSILFIGLIFAPFIIGNFASYKKIEIYTFFQVLILIFSLIIEYKSFS